MVHVVGLCFFIIIVKKMLSYNILCSEYVHFVIIVVASVVFVCRRQSIEPPPESRYHHSVVPVLLGTHQISLNLNNWNAEGDRHERVVYYLFIVKRIVTVLHSSSS